MKTRIYAAPAVKGLNSDLSTQRCQSVDIVTIAGIMLGQRRRHSCCQYVKIVKNLLVDSTQKT